MNDLFVAMALALAIEGMLYCLFPDGMKRMMVQVLQMPSSSVRTAGMVAAIIGVGVVWLLRG